MVALARGITTVIPGGNDTLLPQDQIFIMAATKDLPKLMTLTGDRQQHRHRVMILGGGLVGNRVAQLLEKTVQVTMIEKDEKSAEELSFTLKNTEVLHGDGSDANVLQMAGLLDMDTFITATGDNETNIMSCLLAKHLMNAKDDCRKSQPKKIHLPGQQRGLPGAGRHHGFRYRAEQENPGRQRDPEIHPHGPAACPWPICMVLTPKWWKSWPNPNAPITRKPLSKLDPSYYGKIIIGAIFRDGEWQIAVGDTHIQDNERAIVVCKSLSLKDVQQLFFA